MQKKASSQTAYAAGITYKFIIGNSRVGKHVMQALKAWIFNFMVKLKVTSNLCCFAEPPDTGITMIFIYEIIFIRFNSLFLWLNVPEMLGIYWIYSIPVRNILSFEQTEFNSFFSCDFGFFSARRSHSNMCISLPFYLFFFIRSVQRNSR